MKNSNKTYAKVMLAVAMGFSFAAEATNYTSAKAEAAVVAVQDDQNTPKQQELLGQYADINALTADNIRDAYITLLENARAKQNEWKDQDWKEAKAVVEKLDAKKNGLEEQLGADDKAKIKLLQAEFRALETKGDVED